MWEGGRQDCHTVLAAAPACSESPPGCVRCGAMSQAGGKWLGWQPVPCVHGYAGARDQMPGGWQVALSSAFLVWRARPMARVQARLSLLSQQTHPPVPHSQESRQIPVLGSWGSLSKAPQQTSVLTQRPEMKVLPPEVLRMALSPSLHSACGSSYTSNLPLFLHKDTCHWVWGPTGNPFVSETLM